MKQNIFNSPNYLILDGAMGTELQKCGLKLGEHPDLLSITRPEIVEQVNKSYVESGSNFICTNTFGANAKKLEGSGHTVKQVVVAAVNCAKNVVLNTGTKIMLDVGPIGELLEPNGTLTFEEAYEIFKEIVVCGEKAGADLVLFETMTDLYECKAAVLAAKENTNLPIMLSMTFEQNGRTFTGCSIASMAATLEGIGVDAMGINCSLGPIEILPLAKQLCENTSLPVFIKPNAGLPDPATGKYSMTPESFATEMEEYCNLGVFAFGGCCGTTPETISQLCKRFSKKAPLKRSFTRKSVCATPTKAVFIDNKVTVIGERINPTGKKALQAALRNNDMDYILSQAVEQANAGAQILDVNVGVPGIDEASVMQKTVKALQAICDLPLQLDSTRPEALEAGLRVYNGKAIVNSVNGEKAILDAILPICKKYGASVVGLTLDENGIPEKAIERFEIAKRIVDAAAAYGIPKEDVYIDCLTLTASAQQEAVVETLTALKMVKEQLGVKTVLGVSNISFGLPCREQLNVSFLTLAMAHGLDLPIINPNNAAMMAAVDSFHVLYNRDVNSAEYVKKYSNQTQVAQASTSQEVTLKQAILQGLQEAAANAVKAEFANGVEPQEIVNNVLIPALDEVGQGFEKGTLFLPQLLQSAGAAQSAFTIIKARLSESGTAQIKNGKIVMATVKGDIHDIGKNIVKVILENYGYDVLDLGRDVPVEKVVEAVRTHNAPLVGLSALMTTTLDSMRQTIKALHDEGLQCKVMVGGAVLTESFAMEIKADYYVKDANASVEVARETIG